MATFVINGTNYDYGTIRTSDDRTRGSIKDGDSTESSYVWGGDDLGRMLEHTFNGSRVETMPSPTSLKGSWNPTEVSAKPVCFPLGHEEAFVAAEQAMNLSRSTLSYVSDRLREANVNVFLREANVDDLLSLLKESYYQSEEREASGGHDVRLLFADCIAELNAWIHSPGKLCRCTNSTDGVSKANAFLSSMIRAGAFYYGEVYHIHGTPADLYVVQFMDTSSGPTVNSRPRLTPFGALSELPRLLPENKTKEQLEAIDAMCELIGSPWKVWP